MAAATPAAEMPNWLKALAPAGVTPVEAPAPAEPAAELPDWLQALAPTAATTTAAAVSPAPVPEPAAPVVPAHEPAAPVTTPAEELPDWLKALAPASTPPVVPPLQTTEPATIVADQVPAAAPTEAPAAEQLPDWLKAIIPAPTPPASGAAIAPERMAPAAMDQPPATVTTPAAAPAEEELPDWLKAMAPAATPAVATDQAPAAVPTPKADLPDWLKAISEASATAAAAATAETAATSVETTAMAPAIAPAIAAATAATTVAATSATSAAVTREPSSTLAPVDFETTLVPGLASPPAAASAADQPAAPADTSLPPWLVGVGTGPLPDLPELDEETLAWLADAQKAEAEPEPAGLDLKSARLPAEKPEWLDELAAATPAPPEIAPTPEDELPDWLKALRGQTAEEELQPEAMPDWLRALRGLPPGMAAPIPTDQPTVAATARAAAAAAATTTAASAVTAAAPAGPTPEQAAKTEAAPAPAALEQGALPAWLAAMRPIDIQQPAATEADSYQETLGVLAGMRGVLRAEPVVAQPRKATTQVHSLAVSDAQTANIGLLAELLRPEAALQPARRGRARFSAMVERWAVFAVLLVALILTQFQAQLQLPTLFAPPSTNLPPEAAAVYHLIETLPAGKPALMAFDYEAAQRGELDPGARAVVAHLARHGTPVVAVSLRLTGPAVAEQVLSPTAASGYVNLGFIPGGPVGLLQFAADPRSLFASDFSGRTDAWSTPILTPVHTLADFGLIVLVSGAPESARAWVEQAQPFAGEVPTVAIISASAEPMVRPYYDDPSAISLISGQLPLKGLIVGLGGAAAYERATNTPGAATALWPALGGGLLAAALIIGVGNLFFLLAGGRRRRKV